MKGGEKMKISELQSACTCDDSAMEEFKQCHPKQIISEELPVPVWRIDYKYKTMRNNTKTATKYIILEESSWDRIDGEFQDHILKGNIEHPERKISNVEILDINFIGKVYLQLE